MLGFSDGFLTRRKREGNFFPITRVIEESLESWRLFKIESELGIEEWYWPLQRRIITRKCLKVGGSFICIWIAGEFLFHPAHIFPSSVSWYECAAKLPAPINHPGSRCLLATSRLRSKTFPPLQTDVDTVEKGEMEFWCTVVGENFCSPFERAEESRRRLRRRRRRCLGQMKRESASRHREPLQRESVSVTKDFQSPPKYLPYSSKLFHARLGGMHIIFHRILCRFRVEVKVK